MAKSKGTKWLEIQRTEHRKLPCRGNLCYTVNQCCREIFDVSWDINEYRLLWLTAHYGMLEKT